jgi:addiction module HigA family antidote
MKKEAIKIGMKPSHPGAFIKTEVLDELGLSVTKAAEVLEVRRATLADLVNEKAALSSEMALRLEKAFQLNMDMLLRIQAWFGATEMRK